MQKRTIVFSGLVGLVLMGAVAAGPEPSQDPKRPWKNLKVLSKNLDEEDMDKVMHSFNSQLGVTCIHCHTIDTIQGKKYINFQTDVLPAKRSARDMMKMTFRLNRKYFNTTLNGMMTVKPRVWCTTCHAGLPVPVNNAVRKFN